MAHTDELDRIPEEQSDNIKLENNSEEAQGEDILTCDPAQPTSTGNTDSTTETSGKSKFGPDGTVVQESYSNTENGSSGNCAKSSVVESPFRRKSDNTFKHGRHKV